MEARRWIILSPCNPGARLRDEAVHATRMVALRKTLEREVFRHFQAVGMPAEGAAWPPGPSLLVLDIFPSQVAELARQFGQLTWLAGEAGHPAELVWSSAPGE